MSFLFSNDYILFMVFGASIFISAYLISDKVINFFYLRSAGAREEILALMEKMLMYNDKNKVSRSLYLVSFGLGTVFFLLLWPNVMMSGLAFTVITLLGFMIPRNLMRNMFEKRCNLVVAQMVDGMTIMANGIKSGLSVPQSMERVIENIKGPLADEFQLILNKLRLGMSVEEALNEFGERIPRGDVTMFVTSVNILKETGGNLAETFETITFTIRERQKIERKIQAMVTASITQAVIITAVPFLLIIGFFILDPDYILPLFTKPLGWFALVVMLGLQALGGFMMKKIVTINV